MKPKKVQLTLEQLQHFIDERQKPHLFSSLIKSHGDVLELKVGPLTAGILVANGQLIYDAEKDIAKGELMTKGAAELVGKNSVIVMSPGLEHRRMRKHMNAAFHANVMATYVKTITQEIDQALIRWAKVGQINVPDECGLLARNFIFKTVFKETPLTLSDQQVFVDAFNLFVKGIMQRTFFPTWLHFTIPENAKYQETKKKAYEIIHRIIAMRHASGNSGNDVIGMLLAGQEGDMLDDQTVAENLITLFIAGFETTAQALAWIIYSLATKPEYVQMIRREAQAFQNKGAPFSYQMLQSLPLATQFRKEVLRMYGPSWQAFGATGDGYQLGEYQLPAGALVFFDTRYAQNHPLHWEHPEEFQIDRVYPKWNLTFGAGERICIGKPLAELDLLLFTTLAAKGYQFTVPHAYEPYYNGTLQAPPDMVAIVRAL